jgi:hypothetical protein
MGQGFNISSTALHIKLSHDVDKLMLYVLHTLKYP